MRGPGLSNSLQVQECGHSWWRESSPWTRKASRGGRSPPGGPDSALAGIVSVALTVQAWDRMLSEGPKDAHKQPLR